MHSQTNNHREHTFDKLREYMFYEDNICKWTRFMEIIEKKQKKTIKKTRFTPKKADIFSPRQKDKLFWCFYIMVNGMEKYHLAQNNIFSVEKDFKFATIELFRKRKADMKAHKMKIIDVEDNLINGRVINVKTLQALCFIYEKSVVYKHDNMYYDFPYGSTYMLLEESDKGVIMNMDTDQKTIDTIKENKYYIDINKPIRGISAYNITDILNISTKLGIKIKDNTGKSKTKKTLYEEIVVMIGKLR